MPLVTDQLTGMPGAELALYSVYGALQLARRNNPFTNRRERTIDVVKMRNTRIPADIITFDIGASGIRFLTNPEREGEPRTDKDDGSGGRKKA